LAGHVSRMVKIRQLRILNIKPRGKALLEIGHMFWDNIKMAQRGRTQSLLQYLIHIR